MVGKLVTKPVCGSGASGPANREQSTQALPFSDAGERAFVPGREVRISVAFGNDKKAA